MSVLSHMVLSVCSHTATTPHPHPPTPSTSTRGDQSSGVLVRAASAALLNTVRLTTDRGRDRAVVPLTSAVAWLS